MAHPQENPFADEPDQMSVEEIVFGAMEGDKNCLEWLGRDEPSPLPAKPRETRQECRHCGRVLLLSEFYADHRKLSGRASICRRCDNLRRKKRYRLRGGKS